MWACRRSIFGLRNTTSNHVMGRAVNWQRLMFRYSDPKKREQITSLNARISEIRKQHSSIPSQITPIDWNYWAKTIKTPGIVQTLKEKYEGEMAKQVHLDEGRMKQREKEFERDSAEAQRLANEVPNNVAALEKEVQILEWEKENIDSLDIKYFYDKHPGLEQSLIKEGEEGNWFADPELEKFNTLDFKELRRQLNSGNIRALQSVSFMIPPTSVSLGPYKNVPVRSIEDIIKNYHSSSIWRASQVKNI